MLFPAILLGCTSCASYLPRSISEAWCSATLDAQNSEWIEIDSRVWVVSASEMGNALKRLQSDTVRTLSAPEVARLISEEDVIEDHGKRYYLARGGVGYLPNSNLSDYYDIAKKSPKLVTWNKASHEVVIRGFQMWSGEVTFYNIAVVIEAAVDVTGSSAGCSFAE